jgi:xylulose-5-phosphate/fructose-6-phosphate phosphoketolase
MSTTPLSDAELELIDAYWRAANYLSVGQIYLLDNPLLREPLQSEQIKPRLLGHFGTTPGLNFVYAHLNRAIKARDLSMIYITGPGHGGPGLVANAYLEGTYGELYPHVGEGVDGLRALFRQFSFPGGIPSHVAPETPGSIHEGGELGYALSHAFGSAFDNPDLVVACVVGDGEAETGPLATSWHSNKFLDAKTDGAVLPILHLNGYKIANPTVLARIPEHELRALFEGYGWRPLFVTSELDEPPADAHHRFAAVLDEALGEIAAVQQSARGGHASERPRWPMIVLRTPKGWTGPREVDGVQIEGTWRSHQVPVLAAREDADHRRILEEWMRSYRPDELFDETGRLVPQLRELAPAGERRMSANPHANGGELLQELALPDFREYAVEVPAPATTSSEATRVLGGFLRDVIERNPRTFRLFGPDETASNRLGDVFAVTDRAWDAAIEPTDEDLAPDGRVMEVLSEHQCQGWLEGYLLTGRHGLFNCYEAFIHIVDSMFNQHAKWLKTTRTIPWRRPIASLNYLLSSHVWRQDHNGFSHQDPGFIDHVVNKRAEIIRVYLPPDANCLLSVADHCLRSRHYVNVIVAGKQPALNYLSIDDAIVHCTRGAGIWDWASNDAGGEPDVVMACCGDIPTLETLAAVGILREHLPDLRVRVVNVVDLMRLQPDTEHPHGLSDAEFDSLFTHAKPVVFAYHGYPWLIHRLTYRRTNHANLHVRGYKEEGTTTTPFDMVMLNDLDRFHLVIDAIDRVPGLADRAAHLRQHMTERRLAARAYTREHGDDLPDVRDWTWPH